MKRILAGVLALTLLVCIFSVPVGAEEISSGIYIGVSFDKETGIVSVWGQVLKDIRTKWLTYYLLYPGYDDDDIPNDKGDIVANYGQVVTGTDGSFEVPEFKYSGAEGICRLYITTGGKSVMKEIDTSESFAPDKGFTLAKIHALPTEFPAHQATTVEGIFFESVAELPSEMPVVTPAEVSGIKIVYVDVNNGSDSTGNGSIDNPYKTLKYASGKNRESGTVICLREGTYPMSDNLEKATRIKATEEFPYIITSYPGEEVVVSGGTKIDSGLFGAVTDTDILQRLDPGVTDKVLVADLSELIPDGNYGSISTSNAPVLFVGDSKYTIARWPNAEMTPLKQVDSTKADNNDGTASNLQDPVTKKWVSTNGVIDSGAVTTGIGSEAGQYRKYSKRATELNRKATEANGGVETIVSTDTGIEFCVEDLRPFSWVNTGDIWVYGYFYTEWTKNHLKITEMNADTQSIRTETGLSWGARYNKENKLYYYNVLEELDAPGEWFIDKNTGKLYIYPVGDISDEDIVYATKTDVMWRLYYNENMIINGIKFRHARGRAITVDHGTNNIIQNCTFENLGSGVEVYGGTYSGVINSEFKNLTGKGITLDGTQSYSSMTATRQFAQNNKLHSTTGISSGSGVGNIISHNFVSNNIGSAINVGSSKETVVEYNEIVGGPRETLDSGAFYINGNNHFHRATHVRYNYIHDIGNNSPRGVYFDDMLSGCYAYGNVIASGGIQLHNGSEIVVHNNLILNSTRSIANGPNYYGVTETEGWPKRWFATSLDMGTMAAGLKSFYNNNTPTDQIAKGSYAAVFERYPHLYEWSKLMLTRIREYKGNDKTGYTGKIAGSAYLSDYKPSDEYADGEDAYYNLDRYLRASRDLYISNNLLINSAVPKLNQYDTIAENKSKGTRDSKNGGIIRTTYVNNHQLATDPFTSGNYGDEAVANTYGIERIPFEKMGITSEVPKFKNGKAKPISPADTTETTVLKEDVALQWTPVVGAQLYKVEVAKDEAFTNILETKELRDMIYGVQSELLPDTVYYWRVTTIPQGNGAEGDVMVSDVFKFKTEAESAAASQHNNVGITDYKITDAEGNVLKSIPASGKFNVNAFAYNLSDEEESVTIYIGVYNAKGKLTGLANHFLTLEANKISQEFTIPVETEDGAIIKMFVWASDDSIKPYSFVKTIE